MFVAGFIGSPQMNFLDGTLIKKGDLYGIDLGGDVIPLPKEKTADGKLDSYVGKKIKMGIRPEDIDLLDDTIFHDDDAVAHGHSLGLVVGNVDEGGSQLLVQLDDLGRAMVRNPAVFLLDEPLSNLDAKLRTSMRTEIIKLHKKLATTFIYVTHDQTEARQIGRAHV